MRLRIKELMEVKGITSASIAEKVGIHKVSVSNIINGKINPSTETLDKVANALGVQVWELLVSKEEVMEQDKNAIVCPKCGARFVIENKEE